MSASPQLLRLMQLASPTLPVGAFAYSQGLEWAVENGLDSETKVASWIFGVMETTLARLDVPVMARLHEAWINNDEARILKWSSHLYASRETAELRAEENQTGGALARLLRDLDIEQAATWVSHPKRTFATLFTLAGTCWEMATDDLCAAYLWSWTENQVAAAIKTVPLGQTAGQRIMSEAAQLIPDHVTRGLALEEWEIGGTAPGQIMASALHETQRTRLFRS